MNHSGTMRTPAFGIVPPQDAIVVTIEKPLGDHEQPVVITRQPTHLHIARTYRTKIILQNDSDHPVPYILVVAPRRLVSLGLLPWKRFFGLLQDPDNRPALIQRAAQTIMQAIYAANAPRIKTGDEQ
jgi:hypothetical protein